MTDLRMKELQIAFEAFLAKWGVSADFRVEMSITDMQEFFNLLVPEAYLDLLDEQYPLLDTDVNWPLLNKRWKEIINAYTAK